MSIVSATLRWTGAGKLVGFYKHFSFAGPRTTTGVGAFLLFGSTATYMFWLITDQAFASQISSTGYLIAYFVIQVAGNVLAAGLMISGRRSGWALASLLAVATIAMYVASRLWGLPYLDVLVGWWEYPLGTFLLVLAGTFLALHFGIVTRVFVAYPNDRGWHD